MIRFTSTSRYSFGIAKKGTFIRRSAGMNIQDRSTLMRLGLLQ
ncbi:MULTISPECIES: hypothetical protein [Cytobacillus]|jgi:hypothetical protein|uniref:Uncharacterized protein n=1 Tax=Cytobacillus pseudoceanisediminis TaxID=3051614 RepID=A0ABZ2ZPK1_9BACI|nr:MULTISPECIES: hypothetical protein [Cytobacillus]MCS0789491.1 hypothetical protein [Cytobacillus firmus]MCS0826079.1 hypothetical protein [Cytobacillus firmus]MDK7667504.1 hypothetical protein [Cytobacillus oceanisediminis]